MQVMVDTSVWADYFNGVATPQTDYLHEILGRAPIVVADLIVAEVLQGFADAGQMERVRVALALFPTYQLGGLELALASAAHQRLLRAKREPLPDSSDCLIAALCIRSNVALLHADPGFVPFERHLGLKVPDPASPAL